VVILAPSAAAGIKLKRDGSRKRAPEFELKDAQGKTVHLSDYAGRVVVLDFWATWCGPCKGTIPWLIELSEKYRSAGLTVIGISMDEDGWRVINPFVEKMRITYPILLGNKRSAYLYGDVESLPLAFFVDRNQHVAAIHVGAGSRSDFEKTVKLLLEPPR
jgi:cytochrome c biogenesis protein CcmG/thiol:disulfide interchange protein DsbE